MSKELCPKCGAPLTKKGECRRCPWANTNAAPQSASAGRADTNQASSGSRTEQTAGAAPLDEFHEAHIAHVIDVADSKTQARRIAPKESK